MGLIHVMDTDSLRYFFHGALIDSRRKTGLVVEDDTEKAVQLRLSHLVTDVYKGAGFMGDTLDYSTDLTKIESLDDRERYNTFRKIGDGLLIGLGLFDVDELPTRIPKNKRQYIGDGKRFYEGVYCTLEGAYLFYDIKKRRSIQEIFVRMSDKFEDYIDLLGCLKVDYLSDVMEGGGLELNEKSRRKLLEGLWLNYFEMKGAGIDRGRLGNVESSIKILDSNARFYD